MRYLIIVFIWVLNFDAFSQNEVESNIYNQATKRSIIKYSPDSARDFIAMESAFSEGSVDVVPIKDQRITHIDLVYTAFRESDQFSQKALNKIRLTRLIAKNPQLIRNKFFEWRLVEQTGCDSPDLCRDYFHGFVVYYEKYFTKADTRNEIDTIKQDLSEFEEKITELKPLMRINVQDLACQFPPLTTSMEYISDEFKKYYNCNERFKGRIFFDAKVDDKGRPVVVDIKGTLFPCQEVTENIIKHVLRWKRGLTVGSEIYPFTAKGMIEFPLQRECLTITEYTLSEKLADKFNVEVRGVSCNAYLADTSYLQIIPKIHKEAVSMVLFRNKWEDELIVVDATGSMYPYTADLLKWIRLQSTKKEKTYVFFNDGDDKPTNQKVIGHTGGIYHVETSDYMEVRKTLFESMNNGGGGDLFENNFEALLYSTQVSGTHSAIMIADNYSFPRDQELLDNLEVDLKVILCGTEKGVNTNYLNLAYRYGFSIHTIGTDLENLNSIKPGEKIAIDNRIYQLRQNGFEQLSL